MMKYKKVFEELTRNIFKQNYILDMVLASYSTTKNVLCRYLVFKYKMCKTDLIISN